MDYTENCSDLSYLTVSQYFLNHILKKHNLLHAFSTPVLETCCPAQFKVFHALKTSDPIYGELGNTFMSCVRCS